MARSSSGSGLINPDQFVCRAQDLNTDPVRQAAADLRGFGRTLSGRIDEIGTTWDRLSEYYQSPQADLILNIMDPAQADAHLTADIFEQIANRLEYFAHDLEGVKPRLADFEERAWEFRRRVQNGVEVESYHQNGWVGWATGVSVVQWKMDKHGVDSTRTIAWTEHSPSVEENTDLLDEYARLLEQISESATDAANAVHATHQVVSACTPVPGNLRYGAVTADLIMAGEMPWGEPVSEDRNCAEQVSSGVGDFGYDTFFGITSLLGYHPDTGWSATTLGQTWGGLGNVVGSLVVVALIPDSLSAEGAASVKSPWVNERAGVVRGALGGLVGYDPQAEDGWQAWRDEPWRAGSSSVLNIATFFIPVTTAVKVRC